MNLIWIFRDNGIISCPSFSSPGGDPKAGYCGCSPSDRRKTMCNSLGWLSNVCSEIDAVNLVNKANSVHNSFLVYFLYMFRAIMCPSSGEIAVLMLHLVLVILCGWLSGMQGEVKLHPAYQASHKHSCFFRWWAHSRPKYVEKIQGYSKWLSGF
jgi:hypothetical protein